MEELNKTKVELPKVQEMNNELKATIDKYKREIELMRQIEKSATVEIQKIVQEYMRQKDEIQNMNLTKKQLEEKLQTNKDFYDEEIMKYTAKYEEVKKEAANEIENLKEEFTRQIQNMRLF